jgi:hypothetical protein
MMLTKRFYFVPLVLSIAVLSPLPGVCRAVQPMERHNWSAGVGFGVGPADVEFNSAATNSDWQRGAAPQLRVGRMIGGHFMVGFEDRQWMDESGVQDYKVRGNIQNVDLVVTVFPGRSDDLTSGFLLQAGAGLAHARTSVLEPYPGGANEWGETYEVMAKKDDSGWGFLVGGGYELALSRHLGMGAVFTFNSVEFDQGIYDRVRFIPGALNLTWYF